MPEPTDKTLWPIIARWWTHVVLLLRIVSSWGGPFSRLFGKFGGEVFAQFVGWILTPIALWMAINATITVFELGVL